MSNSATIASENGNRRRTQQVSAKSLKKEKQDNYRIRVRPTREGFHIAFLTLFILLGAVLRDVNLMVILAGSMIGLIFLQWRLGFRTLVGIQVRRMVPPIARSRQAVNVDIRWMNPRPWLAAWFLNLRDTIYRVDRDGKKTAEGSTMSSYLPILYPKSSNRTTYQCNFSQRGAYRFGPLEVSTRFPFCLARSYFPMAEYQDCIVHPAIGEVLPSWKGLFELKRMGAQRTMSQSGANDGEFFGLRNYRIGDSPRWIHWRTSARKTELVVRQFEKQENVQACVLLDLYADTSKLTPEQQEKQAEAVETAIEFVATIANLLVGRGRGTLSVGIAGDQPGVFPRIQSRNQVEALLNELAYVQGSSHASWLPSAEALCSHLRSHPLLVVVSTRSNQWETRGQAQLASNEWVLMRSAVRWLDVTNGDLDHCFRRAPQ